MHRTVYEERAGCVIRVIDRTGAAHAELMWDDAGHLTRLAVAGAIVEGNVIEHPLLGAAHVVTTTTTTTAMTAIDWARPTEIPAIAEPGRLALGAGSAILNVIAILAQRAGVEQLRYAGPYPTSALWRALARSFRCDASEAEFTAGGLERALRVSREPIAIDFRPAPHDRIAIPGGFVELRDQLERAVVDGISYEPGGSPARLVAAPSAWHCEIWFGGAVYARVASLAADDRRGLIDGSLIDGPHPIPPCDSAVVGREFPLALRAAIAALVGDSVAPPLATAARELIASLPLRWADLGARAAAEAPDGLAVHAALWERIAPLGLGRLALALAEALVPVVSAAVVRRASSP